MITYDGIKKKLGFDPLTVEYKFQNDWMCDGEEPPESQKMNLLSLEELDFLVKLLRQQKQNQEAEKRMNVI